MHPIDQIKADRSSARSLDDSNADICFFALSESGKPSVRTLVLRETDKNGFTLFINKTSPKWRIISENPSAGILLWYPSLQRQYRITGNVIELDRSHIETNWPKRPSGSKYLDHAYSGFGNQSSPIDSYDSLKYHIAGFKDSHDADSLTTPVSATGIRLVPEEIEVLDLNDPSRIHNRQLFTLHDGEWTVEQLMP